MVRERELLDDELDETEDDRLRLVTVERSCEWTRLLLPLTVDARDAVEVRAVVCDSLLRSRLRSRL